jgi:Ser/Thr protein kinase RdoA (MazF antagonist)
MVIYTEDHPLYRIYPTAAELSLIAEHYALGGVENVEGDLGGLFNVNLKVVTAKGAFVVRVLSGLATEAGVEFGTAVAEHLRSKGIPALCPLRTRTGDTHLRLGQRIVQVTPFVEGVRFEYTEQQAESCGRMLRRCHDALSGFPSGPKPVWSNVPSSDILEDGVRTLLKRSDVTKQVDGFSTTTLLQVYERITEDWNSMMDSLPQTVIHGDWHPWNLLFDDAGGVRAVMDFDFAQRAARIHDVAYCLWALAKNPAHRALCSPFLRGYGSLEPIEQQLLAQAVARTSFFFVATSCVTPDPVAELRQRWKEEIPFIQWLFSEEGRATIATWLYDTETGGFS